MTLKSSGTELSKAIVPISNVEGNVTLETTMGTIDLELYWQHAPRTCRNFYELARRGFYNNTIFHRLVPGFVIQGGDPTGTGTGGKSIYGDHFEDEITPLLRHTGAGVLSMANTGQPNTNGSQFFITFAPTPFLDNKNTIFGRVLSGMPVIKKMECVPTEKEKPLFDIKILRGLVNRTD